MNKKQLENNIVKIASLIFSIENKNSEDEEFCILKTKIADLIWRWASLIFNESKLKNAGKEIMECINRSLKSYKGDIEQYLNYMSSALSEEIKRANKKLYNEEKNTIHLPDKKTRKIKLCISYAEQYGKNINAIETQKWLANSLGYSLEEITKILQLNVKRKYLSFEDEKDIFEWTNVHNQTRYLLTEELLLFEEENENIKEKLRTCITKIESLFLKERENTANQFKSKTYLAALLTRQFLHELDTINCYECNEIISFIEKAQFCDSFVLKAFIKEELPTQQEIAKMFGKDKTDASRKLKNFIKKVST